MADQWGERMPRSVSLLQTVAVSVGIAIGSGIFRVPATVAAQVRYLAAFAIVLIGSINHIGVQRAAAVQSVTTVLKYAVLAALGLLAFTATGGSTKHFPPAWPAGAMLSPLASALIPVLWTYDGWADPATMGGEISNPQRNLPIALIAGALCAMLVYLVFNIGFLYALATT